MFVEANDHDYFSMYGNLLLTNRKCFVMKLITQDEKLYSKIEY